MKKKIIFILVSLIFIGSIGLWKLNKDFLLLWNCNTVKVIAQSPLSKKKVKIDYGISVNTINRKDDTELFDNQNKYTILFDSIVKNQMINEYGENDFLITYNNEYYISFRQFKLNRRHQHNYNFYFYQKDNDIFVKVNIKGEDAMKFERKMLKIDNAKNYRCNVPVDSAGVIYNMIELTE